MRPKHLTILFAVLAAALLPAAAHAQYSTCYEFACDSYAVYDPVSNEISGYSRTVDYWWEGWYLFAESMLGDPNGETVDDVYAGGYSEAEADVSYVPGPSGVYGVHGIHSYGLEDNIAYDGDSYYGDVWVAPPPVVSSPTGQLTWYSLDPSNPHSIEIIGTGFTDLPWISGCDGGIDQASWAVNSSTDITGSLHVSTSLSSACTVDVWVAADLAFTIALEPAAPPPTPTLSCPDTVTRGDTGTCTVSGVGAQLVSSWQFAVNGATVPGPSGTLSWSGKLVVSGTISVTIAGIGTPLQATITVNPRSWHLAPASPADDEAILLAHTPPQDFHDTGRSVWTWGIVSTPYSQETIESGPNAGFSYYTVPLVFSNISYGYRINPDLVNQNSVFSQNQTGLNGCISWNDLYTQTKRHEYNSATESHWALYSNSMNNINNNPGDYFEARVANPQVDLDAFNTYTTNAVNAEAQQINADGHQEDQIWGVNFSETGEFLGNPNFAPNYNTCQ